MENFTFCTLYGHKKGTTLYNSLQTEPILTCLVVLLFYWSNSYYYYISVAWATLCWPFHAMAILFLFEAQFSSSIHSHFTSARWLTCVKHISVTLARLYCITHHIQKDKEPKSIRTAGGYPKVCYCIRYYIILLFRKRSLWCNMYVT